MDGRGTSNLLDVAFLWVGLSGAAIFYYGTRPFPALMGLLRSWVGLKALADNGRRRIPFAPSIACAVIGTFLPALAQRLDVQ
jgi:hypothetical protein